MRRRHDPSYDPADHDLYHDPDRDPPRARRAPLAGTALALVAGALLVGANLVASRRRARRIDIISRHPDSAPAHARLSHLDERAHVGRSVTINRPREELYRFWRDVENLPKFMSNVEKVAPLDRLRSAWTIKAPGGFTVELASEIVEDRPGEAIGWRTLADSAVQAEGEVRFRDAPAGRGTIVEARITYEPPAGDLGRWIAKAFRREPEIQGRHELKRFKMLMETGEIAVSGNRQS